MLTFKEATTESLATHRQAWRNTKHVHEWERTLIDYAFSILGISLTQFGPSTCSRA